MTGTNAANFTGTYSAKCHCGAVKADFSISPSIEERQVVLCNCTICTAYGYINVYPKAEDVTITGENRLKTYSFPPHNRKHQFCSECGTSIFIVPNDLLPDIGCLGINIRTVEGIDLDKLHYVKVDGRSRKPEDEMIKRP
ncbi:hypothetical protein EJ06DRAFT_527800 [Trichodelitschia bisporula]|uniref:CENP-V/GFA domain-containing protein n=1 Tax=Trichodelitschia bisporula TaxID=703511 RepID=A0A6G1I3R7_9PEZI|nr:hypothetical protein EJ06DRAFT_527800 [Trichodelitschia bisporula]